MDYALWKVLSIELTLFVTCILAHFIFVYSNLLCIVYIVYLVLCWFAEPDEYGFINQMWVRHPFSALSINATVNYNNFNSSGDSVPILSNNNDDDDDDDEDV